MSKLLRAIFPLTLAFLQILHLFNNSNAQDIEATIKIESLSPPIAAIDARIRSGSRIAAGKNIVFLQSFAGFDNLAGRISDLTVYDAEGRVVAARQFIPGEFVAEREVTGWKYKVNLEPLKNISSAAHISWLSGGNSLLMLDDLLPQFAAKHQAVSARIKLDVPEGWKIAGGVLETANIEQAVFLIAKDWRERELHIGGFKIDVVLTGEWQFTDDEAFKIIDEIYRENRKIFGYNPSSPVRLFLLKFPQKVNHGIWEAETRGSTVTIVSSDMPFKTQSIQRLHEQMRHEIFHLWMPNGVNFIGNYDWFYEGFTLYQSLKTGVMLNRIRFEDYLDTLSRAYTIDSLQSQRPSLLEASKNRWSGANTQVYARGMLVAFLSDLALLRKTRGKMSASNLIREIYEAGRSPNPPRDGNEAILKIMSSQAEMQPIVDRYIRGREKIAWQDELKAFGIESTEDNFVTTLSVAAKLSGRQKDLLDKLGYNNWRKLPVNSK